MVLKCRICGQDYVGARAKQSIRMHLQSKHAIKTENVLDSVNVEKVNENNIEFEVPEQVENAIKSENIRSAKTDFMLLSEILANKNINAEWRQRILKAKEMGFIEMNMRTGELKK